ncbi:hypothetical protein KF840_22400 [bacterium]|nr:hypothetical protein [bacterium]
MKNTITNAIAAARRSGARRSPGFTPAEAAALVRPRAQRTDAVAAQTRVSPPPPGRGAVDVVDGRLGPRGSAAGKWGAR